MEESLVLKQNLRPLIPTDTPLHYPKLEILKTCEETEVIGVKRLSVSKAYSVARREEIERWGQNRRTCSGSQVLRKISLRSMAFRLTFHSNVLESDLTL